MTEKSIISKIRHIYGQSDGLNSFRFYRDYSSGFSYTLGDHSEGKHIISITPDDSKLEKLLFNKHFHNLSYDIETAIENAVYCLIRYGVAYIYINAEYSEIKSDAGDTESVLKSLQIGGISGIITKKTETNIEFWGFGPIESIQKNNYKPAGFIEMKLKDLGYSKTHFSKIARKLDRYDATSSSLIYNKNDGYDFSVHVKKNTLQEYKITRKVGWIPNPEGLSESQCYYRKIRQNKLKITMMKYVVDSINKRLQSFIDLDSDGRISVNLKIPDYEELWLKYLDGKITMTELSSIL